jgi:hypothetical protein
VAMLSVTVAVDRCWVRAKASECKAKAAATTISKPPSQGNEAATLGAKRVKVAWSQRRRAIESVYVAPGP